MHYDVGKHSPRSGLVQPPNIARRPPIQGRTAKEINADCRSGSYVRMVRFTDSIDAKNKHERGGGVSAV